jgi:hypothetical protein
MKIADTAQGWRPACNTLPPLTPLQAEALRHAVTTAGCQLRALFGWLHRVWYMLEAQGKDRASPGLSCLSPPSDVSAIMALMAGLLTHDAIKPGWLAGWLAGLVCLDG